MAPETTSPQASPPRGGRSGLRLLAAILGGFVMAGIVAVHTVYGTLHRSLPETEGVLSLAGLSAPADVLRDKWGVPHIFAASRRDAFFAQGFVHAQDRLWQMEFSRRLGQGRLAEILGPAGVPADKVLRAGDLTGLSQRVYQGLPDRAREALEAYAAGVNAFITTHEKRLPPEFVLGALRPEPWAPWDSILLIKLMAAQLAGNATGEAVRAELLRHMSPETLAALNPDLPGPLPQLAALYDAPLPQRASALSALPSALPVQGASNNWVVDGRWTRSGKPLLANDPHLGLTMPSVWYLAHLSWPGGTVIGASLAGVPGIILGRNDHIAWGYTNTGADVQDLFIEKLSPETPEHYMTAAGNRPFTLRKEIIKVRRADPIEMTYRTTEHGPVLPADLPVLRDIVPEGHVIALGWDALREGDQTVLAGLDILEATSGPAFVRAMTPYVAPMQNMVYADVDGHIGLIVPGRVPVRAPENDTRGLLPAPGWKPAYQWTGTIPFAALPQRADPDSGLIVTANNKIVASDYPFALTFEWDRGARAQRIETLLEARRDHDVTSFADIQQDAVSLEARSLLPGLLKYLEAAPPQHRLAAAMKAKLAAWDGTMAADLSEPLVFAAWTNQAVRALLANAGESAVQGLDWRFDLLARIVEGAPAQADLCSADGKGTDCAWLLSAAFDRALTDLVAQQGDRPAQWHWGRAHTALHQHRPFGIVPFLGPYLNREIASAGGADTINRGLTNFRSDRPFANVHAAGYRAIYDLGAPQNSRFIISTGQSGNPLSRHYDDLMPLWAKGAYLPMVTDRSALEAAGAETLRLVPN